MKRFEGVKIITHKSTHVPTGQFIGYSPNKQLISPRSGDALNDERWGVAGAIPVSIIT